MTEDEVTRIVERNLANDGAFAVAYAVLKLARAQESTAQAVDRLAQALDRIARHNEGPRG